MGEDRTPKKILQMRGSRLAGGRGEEPTPEKRRCRLPSELPVNVDEIAKQIQADVEGMDMLEGCDESTINSLAWIEYRIRKTCQWLEDYPEHKNFSNREGRLITLSGEARQLRKVLGLGPAYRANLASGGKTNKSEIEEILG